MAAYLMFNAVSTSGFEREHTLLRTDLLQAPEYEVLDPRFALARLRLKGAFAEALDWSFYAACRNLPPREKIATAIADAGRISGLPAVVRADASGRHTRLYFYDGGSGVRMDNIFDTRPAGYACTLRERGHGVIAFARPRNYKALYGVS